MEYNVSEKSIKQLKKELRMTRIFCVISSAMTGCLLLGGVLLFGRLQPAFEFLQETKPIMEQVSGLDVENINDTLEQVNTTLGSVDWQQVADSLSQLDVEAINSAIQGLDMEELSEAIENLNEAADVMESWGEKLSSFTGIFQ